MSDIGEAASCLPRNIDETFVMILCDAMMVKKTGG
jgi:hypothetical protein